LKTTREDLRLSATSASPEATPSLLNRLLTERERILEINWLQEVMKMVVEAAREGLVIGQQSGLLQILTEPA
jgi:hypothetical protein